MISIPDLKLDASIYKHTKNIYEKELENLLYIIVRCYKSIMDDLQVPNDENKIRDILLYKYLKDRGIRRIYKLDNYIFLPEVREGNKGRTDIHINTPNSFGEEETYYIIECKRLDKKNLSGKTGLNAKYITDGIMRFVSSDYYSCHYEINAMLGFIVTDLVVNNDIIDNLNKLLDTFSETSTIQKLTKSDFAEDYEYQYISKHKRGDGVNLKLYHLMLNFSKIVI